MTDNPKAHSQKVQDLQLIKDRIDGKKFPEKLLMCHVLYTVREYLRNLNPSKDLKNMTVKQIITLAKKSRGNN
jgi:hypothetical protein